MKVEDFSIGDVVYAASTICDRSPLPYGREGCVVAKAGSKGIITLIGHVPAQPERSVFLVRFEDERKNLSNPVGCWLDDLAITPQVSH